jgi:dihydrolipoamide dehydrogenase
VPPRLGVLGGGVVGVEMAQAFASLGSEVHLVISGPRPLPRNAGFAGDLVLAGLREAGVEVHTDSGVSQVAGGDAGTELTLKDGSTLVVDEFLVATGRRPATAGLGLERLGVEPGHPLETGDTGRVSAVDGDWLYAAGDVTGRAPLTHQGKYGARAAGDTVAALAAGKPVSASPWSRFTATADHHAVPQVVFTDPEVAAVGLADARPGSADRVVDIDIAVAGSSLHADGYTGKARMVVDTERNVLLGVTFVGQDVSELLHSATIAIVGEVPLDRLWHAVPSFPTISEVWLRLLEAYGL